MDRTEQKFLKFIDERELINTGEKILVGFSGGPDSVFLLNLLSKFRNRLKIQLFAAHINHSLRGKDAAEDEKFCRKYCKDTNVEFASVKKNVRSFALKQGISLEEAGRILRYKEYNRILKQNKLNKIATAHNSNDNTETVLLNLIKGTGLDGISGIPVARENIIRPVLCFSKDEILAYLDRNNILYRTDKSNEESGFERNFLRNRVIPLLKEKINPSIDSAVLISSENFRKIRDYVLTREAESFRNTKKDQSGNLLIRLGDIKKTEPSLRGILLKTLVERELKIQMFSADIKKILFLADTQTGKKIELSGGIVVFKERDHLKVISGSNKPDNYLVKIHIGEERDTPAGKVAIKKCDPESIVYSNNKNKEYISADTVSPEFTIRRWKEGDSFHPLGMKGSKKVSDFLNEQKVESFGKKNHLILENRNKIVWIIGLRIDNRFKITSSTNKMLELCLN